MEAIYRWVQNIVSYLIFVTIITSLLPAGKYEKYLRLFAGCILILLVLQPLTGTLRLEERINAIFRSISFENEAEELRGQMDEMEEKRLSELISRYEEEASNELARLAEGEGFEAQSVSVSINADSKSREFGKVKKIEMRLKADEKVTGEEAFGEGTASGENMERNNVSGIKIEAVEPVQIKEEETETGSTPKTGGKAAEAAGPVQAAGRANEGEAESEKATAVQGKKVESFRRTVAGYYQMEEENVEIRVEN